MYDINNKGLLKIKTREQMKRDNYYEYLMKKYNCKDIEIINNKITNQENEIRENLESNCM